MSDSPEQMVTLRQLIWDGDVAGVRKLVQASPALVHGHFTEGDTPLHLAAQRNRPDLVELLVGLGAPLDARYGQSAHTPLSWAITVWAFQAAHKLVALGSEPDLFCAAGLGLLDRVKAFWPEGRLRPRPSQTGSTRCTEAGEPLPRPPDNDSDQVSDALYLACRSNRLEVARWLLDQGADPDWRGYCGATCLAWAEVAGDPQLCQLLRERGAADDILDHRYKAPPRVFGLMVMAGWGFPGELKARLAAAPALAHVRSDWGTLLHAAAADDARETARILLDHGADRSARNAEGQTPAELAAARGHGQLAQMLTAG